MSEQQHEQPADDTEGHGFSARGADAEAGEGADDTEGHAVRSGRADAESVEGGDDTAGHMYVEEPRRPDDPRGA